MFGVLAFRFDALPRHRRDQRDRVAARMIYLRRRAWRYLRKLGAARARCVRDVLRRGAAALSRRASASTRQSWVAAHIWGHGNLRYARELRGRSQPPQGADALTQARVSARRGSCRRRRCCGLLETRAQRAGVRLRDPLAARAITRSRCAPSSRRGSRSSAAGRSRRSTRSSSRCSARAPSSIRASCAGSASTTSCSASCARRRAMRARTRSSTRPRTRPICRSSDLVELVERGAAEVAEVRGGASRERMSPQQLGVAVAARACSRQRRTVGGARSSRRVSARATSTPRRSSRPRRAARTRTTRSSSSSTTSARRFPRRYYTQLLDDPRFSASNYALRTHRPGRAHRARQAQRARDRDRVDPEVARGSRSHRRGRALARRRHARGRRSRCRVAEERSSRSRGCARSRCAARAIAGCVEPARVGLSWLLELARSSDSDLAQFAQRMLLESFEPEDFGGGASGNGCGSSRPARSSPRPCARSRRRISRRTIPSSARGCPRRRRSASSRGCGPRTTRWRRCEPLLDDDRVDVRRLARRDRGRGDRALGRSGSRLRARGLGRHKEPRALGIELLMGVIVEGATREGAGGVDRRPAAVPARRESAQGRARGRADADPPALRSGRRRGAARVADGQPRSRRPAVRGAAVLGSPPPEAVARRLQAAQARRCARSAPQRFADLDGAAAVRARRAVRPAARPRRRARSVDRPARRSRSAPLPASIAKRRLIEAMRDLGARRCRVRAGDRAGARRVRRVDGEGRVAGERAGADRAARAPRRARRPARGPS